MRKITRGELARCDGKQGAPAYVAYDGKVYDASRSFLWQRGRHWFRHEAGLEYSGTLEDAPHGPDLLARLPLVGELVDDE